MNIVIFGAGAIGSLFGYFFSKENNVALIGRKTHIDAIKQNGLIIKGKTRKNIKISTFETIDEVPFIPDLLILTVKSYDTENAIKQTVGLIDENTFVLSLQNGLDNVEKIQKYVDRKRILACITTHGVVFCKPGVIEHTGVGKTVIGAIENKNISILDNIASMLSKSGIKTTTSNYILKDIWIKAIVNSCINPVTAIFRCKNGYLLENPVLEKIVEKICAESTNIANSHGIDVSYEGMIKKTKQVITETSKNRSSMLQSINLGKKTEIESINGTFVNIAKKHGTECLLNSVLVNVVK